VRIALIQSSNFFPVLAEGFRENYEKYQEKIISKFWL